MGWVITHRTPCLVRQKISMDPLDRLSSNSTRLIKTIKTPQSALARAALAKNSLITRLVIRNESNDGNVSA
ncbi:MAG: hypothetical protein ACI9SP_004736 [Arenicella sp.]|jgi:hypothetical protein